MVKTTNQIEIESTFGTPFSQNPGPNMCLMGNVHPTMANQTSELTCFFVNGSTIPRYGYTVHSPTPEHGIQLRWLDAQICSSDDGTVSS